MILPCAFFIIPLLFKELRGDTGKSLPLSTMTLSITSLIATLSINRIEQKGSQHNGLDYNTQHKRFVESHIRYCYAACAHCAKMMILIMFSVIKLSANMLCVTRLNVIMLCAIMLFHLLYFNMLCVTILRVFALSVIILCVCL